MFNLLYRSAWASLKHVIEARQQFEPAAAMVLHTWNQKRNANVHDHALVAGGGPSLRIPGTWRACGPPMGENQHQSWLVDADELRVEFGQRFLDGLRRRRGRAELRRTGDWSHLQDQDAFDQWLRPQEDISWVTHIWRPSSQPSPEHVVKYLARYMTGSPISDRRPVSYDDRTVVVRALPGTTHGGSDETEEPPLSGVEFVRRWSLHILPCASVGIQRMGEQAVAVEWANRVLSLCSRSADHNLSLFDTRRGRMQALTTWPDPTRRLRLRLGTACCEVHAGGQRGASSGRHCLMTFPTLSEIMTAITPAS